MEKITRIAYNTTNWQRPTGDAGRYESRKTFNHKFGFGYEDWLCRNEWLIGGWRYAFIQGASRSRLKLVRDSQPVNLTLFTREPDKRRRYVASIRNVECLGEQQAKDAFEAYKQLGWYQTMRAEILAVKGDVNEFDATQVPWNFVNVRFRLSDVTYFPPDSFANASDPVFRFNRYQLHDLAPEEPSLRSSDRQRHGGTTAPRTTPYFRSAVAAVQCNLEHARMQAILMKELRREYPSSRIVREQDFVDIRVTTESNVILFEIKTALQPQLVIREALGQILEYAYHPSRQYQLPVSLVIVGRRALTDADEAYLKRLRTAFQLPLSYREVSV